MILSGFRGSSCTVECFKRARPNEKYKFEFTTSSKTIQDRLERMIKLSNADTPNVKRYQLRLKKFLIINYKN